MISENEKARKHREQRIDELSRMRAAHMAKLLECRPASSIKAVRTSGGKRPDIQVFAVCIRELEWLGPEVKLEEKPVRRVDDPEADGPQLWAEYASSVLTMISRERYYVAAKAVPPGTREVFPVSSVKAERVPYELKFRNINAIWFQRRPPAPVVVGAPSLTTQRLLLRSGPPARRPPVRSSRR